MTASLKGLDTVTRAIASSTVYTGSPNLRRRTYRLDNSVLPSDFGWHCLHDVTIDHRDSRHSLTCQISELRLHTTPEDCRIYTYTAPKIPAYNCEFKACQTVIQAIKPRPTTPKN